MTKTDPSKLLVLIVVRLTGGVQSENVCATIGMENAENVRTHSTAMPSDFFMIVSPCRESNLYPVNCFGCRIGSVIKNSADRG